MPQRPAAAQRRRVDVIIKAMLSPDYVLRGIERNTCLSAKIEYLQKGYLNEFHFHYLELLSVFLIEPKFYMPTPKHRILTNQSPYLNHHRSDSWSQPRFYSAIMLYAFANNIMTDELFLYTRDGSWWCAGAASAPPVRGSPIGANKGVILCTGYIIPRNTQVVKCFFIFYKKR